MVAAFTAIGGFQSLNAVELFKLRDKVKLRFIIASDAHYGQPDTAFDQLTETFIEKANYFHSSQPCDFCVLNGDLIHDEPHLMPTAKKKFDQLEMPFYVTKGNHDRISDSAWKEIWGMPVNLSFRKGKNAFVLATTSDENGTYLSPNLDWMKDKLDENKKQKNTFIFIHIPQAKWTKHAIDTPAFLKLVSEYNNVKAVFHGHEHDQDGIIMHRDVPFIFDAHIGGNWGTTYLGFRVVEVLKGNTIVTYMMNPVEALERKIL
jgi:3',5'-cyclic AMP phosphodiesterase CpdA